MQDGAIMNRPVKKLFDLEIDEISVVDRPANQHGLIAFAKSAGVGEGSNVQEDEMPVFTDGDGVPVDTDALEHGDLVYDENGVEYVFAEDEGSEDLVDERELVDAGVDKAGGSSLVRGAKAGIGGWNEPGLTKPGKAANWALRNKKKVGAGAGLVGATGAGGAYMASKSLGDSILEELSKAVTEDDRNKIVAKAMDEVAKSQTQIEELSKALESERDERITEAFISKAEEYNLPVSPEVFGPILKAIAEVLDDEQLDVLDAVLTSVGDMIYDEIGYVGDTDNASVINQVNAYADELVGKADVTHAAAMVALLEANPAAYDAYLAENGR